MVEARRVGQLQLKLADVPSEIGQQPVAGDRAGGIAPARPGGDRPLVGLLGDPGPENRGRVGEPQVHARCRASASRTRSWSGSIRVAPNTERRPGRSEASGRTASRSHGRREGVPHPGWAYHRRRLGNRRHSSGCQPRRLGSSAPHPLGRRRGRRARPVDQLVGRWIPAGRTARPRAAAVLHRRPGRIARGRSVSPHRPRRPPRGTSRADLRPGLGARSPRSRRSTGQVRPIGPSRALSLAYSRLGDSRQRGGDQPSRRRELDQPSQTPSFRPGGDAESVRQGLGQPALDSPVWAPRTTSLANGSSSGLLSRSARPRA